MRSSALARRYAGALFETAKDADLIDQVESDLGLLTFTLESTPRLKETLTHPLIPPERKKEIVADLLDERVQGVTLHFLDLLIDKRRTEILEDVEEEYVRLANEYRNVMPVMVTSAIPLTCDEKSALRKVLEQSTGKTIELQLEEDPKIIGGLTIQIGDTVIDGSVRGYLEALREQLLGQH
ncbi:MAG TPA: F0F1 ATP synthase subunit delta [Armatimonadota bacterium]|nr:F0F1 ATP synthase subunit delta [Armatimonadota bacterium]